jgi:hypothetical protein
MIRYPRRFRCRGPHLTPPDLRPKTHVFEWYPKDLQFGSSPKFDAMCRMVFGRQFQHDRLMSGSLSRFMHDPEAMKTFGILKWSTWEAEGGFIQGIQVIKRPRLSPKLVASLPLLKRPKP